MRDISALKERIDQAELQLKAAENDRVRESDALMKMWRQIRQRFVSQEQEIANYRDKVTQLMRRNEELAQMVETMVRTIEASAEGTRDETAAKVSGLAEELLNNDYPARSAHLLEEPGDEVAEDFDEPDDVLELNVAAEEDPDARFEDDDRAPSPSASDESRSPGIRSLVGRFEAAMHRSVRRDRPRLAEPPALSDDRDGERNQNELENLRHELQGLRRRMTETAGAP